ncbi:MAG: farnesyl diphosphate synthase [Pirellulales bacterium]
MQDGERGEFERYVAQCRQEVNAALERYTAYDADCPATLGQAIRHSLLAPGKRLRPLLVLMAAEACGCARERALPAACAVEMVHTYSLIHDDLPAMDDDDLRRGLPTCHAVYGEAVAILAGDALLAQAFEVVAGEGGPGELAARGCLELARAAGPSALVGGQVDDLAAETAGGGPDDLERIHRRKTGAMFLVSLRLGALAAGADAAQLAALDRYGRALGLAFQIVDDLLDVKGDAATVGKRVGKDSARGKLTFPGVWGEAASRERAARLVGEAIEAVAPWGDRARYLIGLARYVLERNR